MSTKKRVLEILESGKGKNISGEFLADTLKVSRNTVWKAINELRNDGYSILAVTNKGYCFSDRNDILSAEGIRPFLLSGDYADIIHVYKSLESTNKAAKEMAVSGAQHGTVIISDYQTGGRGRYSRGFFSPPGCGLYVSFILHANAIAFTNPTAITAYAALCVCEAIENTCDMQTSIKWVNDIFLKGKKICGILTEAITEFESQSIGEIILGIGINVSTRPEDFPETIREIAGSLYPDGNPSVSRNRLAAEIINRILFSDMPKETELFARYKKRLFMLGTNITVIQGKHEYTAKALDIDEQGHLIVQTADGSRNVLSSGEITIRTPD